LIWLEAVAAALVGLALLALVLSPVLGGTMTAPVVDDEPEELDETPRGMALLALKEIEFDRATGKLSDEDYASLKARYTEHAIAALRSDRPEAPALAPAADAPPDVEAAIARRAERIRRGAMSDSACPVCGPRPEADAVFCSTCGRSVGRIAS
jgi:hypothetical protein